MDDFYLAILNWLGAITLGIVGGIAYLWLRRFWRC